MIDVPEHIIGALENHFQGRESPEEKILLDIWRSLHPDHEEEFTRLMRLWSDSGDALAQPEFDSSEAWQAMESRIARKGSGLWARIVVAHRNAIVAATIGAFALVGVRIFCRTIFRSDTADWTSIVAAGRNKKITLTDGSTVSLRNGATLQYPDTFEGPERRVMLTGEAFFDIRPEKNRPFRIGTGRSITEVLGTSFLINATSLSDRIIVTTGSVRFSDKSQPDRNCILAGTQEAILSEKGLEKKSVSNPNYLSWQTGRLVFRQTPLDEVVADLSDRYGVSVQLADSLVPKARTYPINSVFTAQSLEQCLEEIRVFTGLQYEKKDTTIIIYQP